MKLDGYVRVSKVGGREGERFISPSAQREQIHGWAKLHGHEIASVEEDLDLPGSTTERPGLQRVMDRIEAKHVDGVIVAKLDRFGRSVVQLFGLLERVHAAGGRLICVAEGVDTQGPTGRLIAHIMSAIGEWELERIREGWKTARENAVSRGVHVAGRVPTGYLKGEDGRLQIDPESGALITELFKRRISGDSWAVLADWLSDQGIVTPWGNETWSRNTIRAVVANRVYLGEARGGKALVKEGAHAPLVTVAEWEAANRVKGVAPGRNGNNTGLLTGILRCAGCRYAMSVSQKKTRHGKRFLEYRCKSARKEHAGRCQTPSTVKLNVIEDFVMESFWDFVGNYRATGWTEGTDVLEAAEAAARAAENELEAALSGSLADRLGGDESDIFLRVVEERKRNLDNALERLGEARAAVETFNVPDIDLRSLWPDLEIYEQKKLISSAFDAVFVRRGGGPKASRVPIVERTYLCPHGSDLDLPVRGQRWVPKAFEFPGDHAVPLG